MGVQDRRDSALIDAAIDAARVTDDFVNGVLQLRAGQIGDDNRTKSWLQRRLGGRGQRSVVKVLGARYAPEQLRKAADEADELVAAVDALGVAWTPPAKEAFERVEALRVGEVPGILRDPATVDDAARIRDVHERLARTISLLNEAHARTILIEMRVARGES